MLTPRYIHYNPTFALHLTLDPQIPPLLHISQESRSFALEWYKIHTLGTRRIYLHPTLDVVLWIRCPGSSSSSRAFRADAQHLLQDIQTSPLDIPNFAISIKYWNRIVKKAVYKELYERIRGGAERLWVVDDVYGAIEGKRVRGARVGLRKWKRKVTGRREELWRMWDGMAGVENVEGEGEERLAEVGFKRVVFMLKN
jgi:hypothetical protein